MILLSIISCGKESLQNRRVPLHNDAFLNDQNKFYDNYNSQDAYMLDSKGDKTFFNNLFDGDSSDRVSVVDETQTGNLQKMSKEFKVKKENNEKNEKSVAISVLAKPDDLEPARVDSGYIPNDISVMEYQLLSKSLVGNYVQVAAFKNYQAALNITAPLLKHNNVVINERDNDSGGKWYRVRVGPAANRDLALLLQKDLVKAGYKNSLIIVEK